MKVRGVIPLLAIAMMASGGVHPTADRHGAVTPTVGPAPSSLHSVPDDSPHPVLRQTASGQWTTTVLLTDVLPACYYLAAWRTVTRPGTPSTLLSLQVGLRRTTRLWDLVAEAGSGTLSVPDLTAQVTQVAAAASVTGDSTTASFASASSCEVTLTFARLPRVPETASLVFNDAGASFAIPLTVNRYVSFWDYLAIPALAGFISVLCLALLLILMLMRVPDLDDRRPGPLRDPDPDDKRRRPLNSSTPFLGAPGQRVQRLDHTRQLGDKYNVRHPRSRHHPGQRNSDWVAVPRGNAEPVRACGHRSRWHCAGRSSYFRHTARVVGWYSPVPIPIDEGQNYWAVQSQRYYYRQPGDRADHCRSDHVRHRSRDRHGDNPRRPFRGKSRRANSHYQRNCTGGCSAALVLGDYHCRTSQS